MTSGLCQDKTIVAKVNDKPISAEYFNAIYERFLQDFRTYNPSSPVDKETINWARRYVMDEMIKRELILQESKRMKFNISDAEIEGKIKEDPFFKGKDGKFDRTKYLWAVNNPNIKWKEIRDSIREELLYPKFYEYMMSREKVSDEEIREEYVKRNEKMKVQYTIIKSMTVSDTEKVNELKIKLKNSTEFETEVTFTRLQYYIEGIGYAPDLVKTSFDSAPGEIREVNIPGGICLYKAIGKIAIDEKAFMKEKEDLKKSLTQQKNSQAFEKWYEELKSRSKITVYLEGYSESKK